MTDIPNFNKPHTIPPQFNLGQSVATKEGAIGQICGFIFYPDLADWCYGIYISEQDGGQMDEIWYHADELRLVSLISLS